MKTLATHPPGTLSKSQLLMVVRAALRPSTYGTQLMRRYELFTGYSDAYFDEKAIIRLVNEAHSSPVQAARCYEAPPKAASPLDTADNVAARAACDLHYRQCGNGCREAFAEIMQYRKIVLLALRDYADSGCTMLPAEPDEARPEPQDDDDTVTTGRPQQHCQSCGQLYTPQTAASRFCRAQCRKRHHKRKQRAQRLGDGG